MSPYVRKVRTASGATAVQIAETVQGRRRIVEHIGSAHTEAELAALIAVAKGKIDAGQQHLDLQLSGEEQVRAAGEAVITRYSSELLWTTLISSYWRLGFGVLGDDTFAALVCARLVEPTSKLDTLRVLDDIGIDAPHCRASNARWPDVSTATTAANYREPASITSPRRDPVWRWCSTT